MQLCSGAQLLIWIKTFPLGSCGYVQQSCANIWFKKVQAGDDFSHSECKHYGHRLPKYAWYVILVQTLAKRNVSPQQLFPLSERLR